MNSYTLYHCGTNILHVSSIQTECGKKLVSLILT